MWTTFGKLDINIQLEKIHDIKIQYKKRDQNFEIWDLFILGE